MTGNEYYDAYWGERGFVHAGDIRNAHLLSLVKSRIPRGSSVLDVGCGEGTSIAPIVRQEAMRYVGVGVSATAVAFARRNGLDARPIEHAGDLPFEDASFDAALCLDVFEPLTDPREAGTKIARVLPGGGVLIASAGKLDTGSSVYRALQRRFRSLFARRLYAVASAQKP